MIHNETEIADTAGGGTNITHTNIVTIAADAVIVILDLIEIVLQILFISAC